MSVWIKICGLSSAEAVAAAVQAGVDALGFVFHAASPRHVSPTQAAALAAAVPAGIARVAVTRHPTQDEVDAIVAGFAPDYLQTDATDLERLRLPARLGRLPVLRTGAPLPAPLPARCLYEGADSGRGARADWQAAAELARRCELVLAGGLDAGNVAAAMRAVRPFGVDVSSGVEQAPGRKDPARIREFVAAARAAAAV
ncbi:MAG: N-(5'-phosphoribosyl)anthranilate isomerase [Proteobacteria bacterium]|nr:N-(5'-phosphoribosyl)anthranilate isomerase [Pseudomonadota bacterium]